MSSVTAASATQSQPAAASQPSTSLIQAAFRGHSDAVEQLLRSGVDVNAAEPMFNRGHFTMQPWVEKLRSSDCSFGTVLIRMWRAKKAILRFTEPRCTAGMM